MTWYEPSGAGYITTVAMAFPDIGVNVPEGYRFNVSVPKRFTWFVDPHDDRYFEAALLHDYVIHERGYSRPLAAGYWNEGLRNSDVKVWKRKLLFVILGLHRFE
jgi:hypothetical protein